MTDETGFELDKNPASPVLKWAGGKRKVLEQLRRHYPIGLTNGDIDSFAEPFVGAGAVFFDIAQRYSLEHYYLYDINPELILVYQALQYDPEPVIRHLQRFADDYFSVAHEQRADVYYRVREHYNTQKPCYNPSHPHGARRAAMTLFLNRTCFNGLYRVNRQGQFNVPHGRYLNPGIVNRCNLTQSAELLQKATLKLADFSEISEVAHPGLFIYYDPPYKPMSKTALFNHYTRHGFDDHEQQRLCDFYHLMHQRGVKQLLSNSDPYDDEQSYFDELYQPFSIHRILAARNINAKATKRGPVQEIVVKNYQT